MPDVEQNQPTEQMAKLRQNLVECFNEEELRTLCFDLQIEYEDLPARGREGKARELVSYLERRGRIPELVQACSKLRPNVSWVCAPDGTPYDTRERYLAQLIDRHQDLEFVGIPELKDRQALRIEEVFIHLQTEVETKQAERDISAILFERDQEGEAQLREGPSLRLFVSGSEAKRELGEADQAAHFLRETIKRRLAVNEALREGHRMVILGDPGAGKTTLLKYITLAFAQGQSARLGLTEERLPIFIRLYDYVAKRAERQYDYGLADYLYTQARESLCLTLEPGFFERELERGNCCVCLDGLDELGGAGLRREVTTAVAALASRYGRNRYIVSSRSVGYEEAPLDRREFAHHTVLPFGDDDICEFVRKWYAAREKEPAPARERAEHLVKTIMDEPRIKTLATNPLMLTIIALVHRIEAELPHERVKLYDKCVTALVETWEKVKGLKIEDRLRPYYRLRRRLLEQLAYWMHADPQGSVGPAGLGRQVKEGDLELQLTRFLLENPKLQLDDEGARQEARDFIALAKARTGLLIERGEGIYTFAHLTFQEYLAAADIEHRLAHSIDDIWDEIKPHLHDPHWREVILLLLGGLNRFEKHPTELVRHILQSTDRYEDVLHRHLFLAARALADRVEVDVALHDEIVDRLLKIAHSDKPAHYDALKALGSLRGDRRAGKGLFALTRDGQVEAEVRSAAAGALGQLGSAEDAILSGLLALAHDGQVEASVRRSAALALRRLGRAKKAVALLLALARDEQIDIIERHTAAFALGWLARTDEFIFSSLLTIVSDRQADFVLQGATVLMLGQLGRADEATLSSLLALARDGQAEAGVRSATAQAIGQLGHIEEAVAVLLALARDKQVEARTRSSAAQALSQLGHTEEATALLLDLARDGQVEAETRCDAALAIGQLGRADEATVLLLDLARDEKVKAGVQCEAAQALGQLGRADEAVLSGLLALACDGHVEVGMRYAAAQALGQLGRADEAVLSGLLALACDGQADAWVRSEAAQALGQLGHTDQAAAELLALARDGQVEAGVRSEAARALGQLGHTDEAITLLLALACDGQVEPGTRRDAARALGGLGHADEAILSGLLDIARDETAEYSVRSEAYESLKTLLGREATDGQPLRVSG